MVQSSSGLFSKYIRTLSNKHRQKFEIGFRTENMVGAKRRCSAHHSPKNPESARGSPRSAWLLVGQCKIMIDHTRKFFIYTRESAHTEDRQVRSISDQLAELKELAVKEQLRFVDIFVEKQTAKAPGRPVFNEMLLRYRSK